MMHSFGIRMAGMMTARFLLHLRKWGVKHAEPGRTTGSDENPGQTTDIVFQVSQRASRSYIDDFGEDPVRCAQQHYGQDDGVKTTGLAT